MKNSLTVENVYNARPNGENHCGPISFNLKEGEYGLLYSKRAHILTDLLTICSGWKEPISGTIKWWDNIAPTAKDSRNRYNFFQQLGLIQLKTTLFDAWQLIENFSFTFEYHENISQKKALEKSFAILDEFNLADKASTKVSLLSSSEQRMALYALILSNNPKLLLLENPRLDLEHNYDLVFSIIEKRVREEKIACLITGERNKYKHINFSFQLKISHLKLDNQK